MKTGRLKFVKHIFYAYVDGSDLHDIENLLVAEFNAFISSQRWVSPNVNLVNQVYELELNAPEDCLPDWFIGLNIGLAKPQDADWFQDIEAVINFLGGMNDKTGREFVVGVADKETGFTHDLMFVDDSCFDLEVLKSMINNITSNLT